MLIRALTTRDKAAWTALSHEWDEILAALMPDISVFFKGFDDYMAARIAKHGAVMALNRMSNHCLGIAAFSQANNRISYLGVSRDADFRSVGSKLLETALNQLDNTREISAILLRSDSESVVEERNLYQSYGFLEQDDSILEAGAPARLMVKHPSNDKFGYSFHHDYPGYIEWTDRRNCPFCLNEPAVWSGHVLIAELEHSYVKASIKAQGCLWGKCVLQFKKHYVEIYDIPPQETAVLMSDVQRTAKALKEISGAAKINLEFHGNTIPHLHVHLFPRYLDDLFAGKAIDYTRTEPSPYENETEFDYFVEQMRAKLNT